ncbi:WxcM-like domain-containing protein [Rhizobium phaseoli]
MTFGPGSILLVFASHGYDKDDYIDTPYERL